MALEFFTPADSNESITTEIVEFLDSQNTGHPFQFPQWAGLHSQLVLRREAGRINWFACCGIHSPLGTRIRSVRALRANRGPVCDDGDLFRETLTGLAVQGYREGWTYIDAAPERVIGEPAKSEQLFDSTWKPLDQSRFSMRLDLTMPDEEILARMRSTTRYKVRKAERAEVSVDCAMKDTEIDEFVRLYLQTVALKAFAADPPDHMRDIIRWLVREPARGALLLARHRSVFVAGAVVVRCGRRCWYIWGANERREDFSTGHLVQWHAILWAKSHGCTEYDFGGYSPGASSGPAWFKEGFGGKVVQFEPAQRYVFRPCLYHLVDLATRLRG